MRVDGASYRAIAAVLGVSHTWAQRLVRVALECSPDRVARGLALRELDYVDGRLRSLRRRRRALVAAGGGR